MVTSFIRKRQKAVAGFLFLLFYAEMIGGAYASHLNTRSYNNRIPVNSWGGSGTVKSPGIFSPTLPQPIAPVLPAPETEKETTSTPVEIKTAKAAVASIEASPEALAIGGPGQPETSTFKSVGTDNMVNLFNGDFSYNIPLLDVDGYPINIFYNAGATMDQESSWVGLGWNINPGSINRNMRGVPDDFDGATGAGDGVGDYVEKIQSMKEDITVGVTGSRTKEIAGMPQNLFAPNTMSLGVFYNNKRGLGLDFAIKGEFGTQKLITKPNKDDKTQMDTVSVFSPNGLSAGVDLNSQTGLTPSISFQKNLVDKNKKDLFGISTSLDFNSRTGLGDLRLNSELKQYKNLEIVNAGISFARASYTPSIRMPVTNFNATFSLQFGPEKKPITKMYSVGGYYTKSGIAQKYRRQEKKAYGYMYYEDANNNPDALLDFNRLNDGSYTYKTPVISVPVYTYDVFSITGEGTGGTFRGFRGNMGYVRDSYTRTNSGKVNLDIELGAKDLIKGGTRIGGIYSGTSAGEWSEENALKRVAAFRRSDKLIQSGFYFKNPAEKAIIDETYYNAMGKDALMRPVLGTPYNVAPPFTMPTVMLQSKFQLFNSKREATEIIPVTNDNSYRKDRDKRTQVISYLTAKEADAVGLDKYIYSYTQNVFKPANCGVDLSYKTPIPRYPLNDSKVDYRKKNHISEITVQEGDKRYIYGLPVYQKTQKDVTFSTNNQLALPNGTSGYNPGDNTTSNNKGKDHYFQSETISSFAHSFLLTAILSPDYSDLTGDGISDDDLGTAVKFNYSRVNRISVQPNSYENFRWRMPMDLNAGNFNRGLVTDNEDNKELYTYGEKELWYTHSIESKNMIATFTLSDREDGYGVKDENGGLNTGGLRQKKLDRIDLYSKADFLRPNAKPVKTVHFTYNYKLVPGYAANGNTSGEKGKLTLESIFFTYNNNNHQKNKYVFKYGGEELDPNTKQYNPVEIDRWGTYKPHAQNTTAPGTEITNEDFPYSLQNKVNADANAAMWNLKEILLPGGAKINVNYESDDYGFVQDRRAAEMTRMLGFGNSPSATPTYTLFNHGSSVPWDFKNMDFRYVFFDAPVTVANADDIYRLYLKDMKQLLLKLYVKVPKDAYGQGYEPMFVYCNIEEVGVVAGSNGAKFYVKVDKASRNSGSQIMETVYQFLRDNLPSKAYPGSDVGQNSGLGQLVKALFAMVNNIRTGVLGFENNARWDGWCREVDGARSVARLSDPNLKKLGGGHRVKSIIVTDNWKKMTEATASVDSYYGQEYDYTTTELVGTELKTISSGVASYEPGVGNEENPFREILQYSRTNPLGPTSNSNIELPFAETFFPSPSIGYSRVTVKSIHNKSNKNIKSGVGSSETQFYTTRDFPTISEYTDFDVASRHHHRPSPINRIFNFAKKDYMTLSQGFRVMLNDMNGKVKMQASYAEKDLKNPINKTSYFYKMNKIGENKYTLDNLVPVVKGPDGNITAKLIGKDIEIMNDFREHFTFTHSGQIPINVDFFKVGWFPVIIPTVFRAVFRDESLYRSATTLKIVNQFGILDKVENIDKGSVIETQNLIYDAETGEALVTQTSNEFNKPVYNFTYPAHWAEEGMGQAYKNMDAVFKNLTFRNGKIEGGLTTEEISKMFESGDELYVVDGPLPVINSIPCVLMGQGPLLLPKSNESRIWALDITKDVRNTQREFIFIDRYGNLYNAAMATARVIRSGRRNLVSAAVGSITSMNDPGTHNPDGTYKKIVIDPTTKVVNTSAIQFREKWKTQEAFYTTSQFMDVSRPTKLHVESLYPDEQYSYVIYESKGSHNPRPVFLGNNTAFTARAANKRMKGGKQLAYYQKSWAKFNFSTLANSTIHDAHLNLWAHTQNPIPYAPGHNFGYEGSHGPKDPHYREYRLSNDFELSRIKSSIWPSPNSAGWSALYGNNNLVSGIDRVIVPNYMGSNSTNARNYAFNLVEANQGWIDVKTMVQQMLKDKDDPTKNYVPGFRIGYPFDRNYVPYREGEVRVCFNNSAGFFSHNSTSRPRLDVSYYRCSEAYGLPGNPSEPPPGQAVVNCVTRELVTTCHSVFGRNLINPYVQGLLGNWRPLKSYVFNGEREGQYMQATTTNISKDGIIKDYVNFWNMPANEGEKLTKTTDAKWVSTSEITQYNRKGAELENVDPLERYNSSIYGYNEALPIAIASNSKLRLAAFDGFEDYFYTDQSCNPYCPPNKRHFDTKINTANLATEQSHSGKYSLRTDANFSTSIKVKVSADGTGSIPDMYIHKNVTTTNVTTVQLQGTGLRGTYTYTGLFGNTVVLNNNMVNVTSNNSFPGGMHNRVSVVWEGSLQVQQTGTYRLNFLSLVDDVAQIYINKNDGAGMQLIYTQNSFSVTSGAAPNLVAGTLYPIKIVYRQETGPAICVLSWTLPGATTQSIIPRENLYMPGAPGGPVTTQNGLTCVQFDQVKPLSNFFTDEFNLVPGKKMVASVWVKKGTDDCRCPNYTGFTIKMRTATNSSVVVFAPKSKIIEGWQLFEAEFTVPSDNEIQLFLDNSSALALYIDDLRFHPFNSTMKSYVYNPYNLKPQAELDENNYSTFYEYDDDGALIRVKKETSQGIKTLQESRSGLQKAIQGL